MDRIALLAERRAELLSRSTRLRNSLALETVRLSGQMSLFDRGFSLARSVTRQPVLLAAGALLLLSLRPLRAMRWATRGALLFSLARRLIRIYGRVRSGTEHDGPPTFI